MDEAAQLGHSWAAALLAKKAAMEDLLKAQQLLEEIQESIAEHLPIETIESAQAGLLSTLNPSHPEALYLLRLGQISIRPLSSRLLRSNSGISCIQTGRICP